MIYTLILTMAMSSNHYSGGAGVAIHSVTGFKDEKSCLDAGWKTPKPDGGKYQTVDLTYVCVPQEQTK